MFLTNNKGNVMGLVKSGETEITCLAFVYDNKRIEVKKDQAQKHILRYFRFKGNLIPMRTVIEDGELVDGDYVYEVREND